MWYRKFETSPQSEMIKLISVGDKVPQPKFHDGELLFYRYIWSEETGLRQNWNYKKSRRIIHQRAQQSSTNLLWFQKYKKQNNLKFK